MMKPILAGLLVLLAATAGAGGFRITEFGADGGGETLNTKAIQSAIDAAYDQGGGTVVIPEGVFVSGALFLKPGVNLHLDEDAVLQCSTDMENFPEQRTRIEGHFEEKFNPALINADGCDGLVIDGEGTLDGAGKPIWDVFWERRAGDSEFRNLAVARARLCLIENSKNVTVRDVTFKDAQFWSLHIYNCRKVVVEGVRFVVPDDEKPPSSDGVDVDSSQHVVIRDCYFSVNDDCIALKGTKGPFAMQDKTSLPVSNIRVSDCVFMRGHGMVTCGSEATIIRDVIVEDCVVKGKMPIVRFKLRPDTPQRYENFTFQDISIDSDKTQLFQIKKWTQYFDLQGQPEPASFVGDITVADIEGTIGSLGIIQGNAMTQFGRITLKDVDVTVQNAAFDVSDTVTEIELDDVEINGKPFVLDR